MRKDRVAAGFVGVAHIRDNKMGRTPSVLRPSPLSAVRSFFWLYPAVRMRLGLVPVGWAAAPPEKSKQMHQLGRSVAHKPKVSLYRTRKKNLVVNPLRCLSRNCRCAPERRCALSLMVVPVRLRFIFSIIAINDSRCYLPFFSSIASLFILRPRPISFIFSLPAAGNNTDAIFHADSCSHGRKKPTRVWMGSSDAVSRKKMRLPHATSRAFFSPSPTPTSCSQSLQVQQADAEMVQRAQASMWGWPSRRGSRRRRQQYMLQADCYRSPPHGC